MVCVLNIKTYIVKEIILLFHDLSYID